MVPGVAYSGYKYEHDKNQTAANTTSNTHEQQACLLDAAAKNSRQRNRVA